MLRQSTRRTVSMFYDIFTGGFYQDEMGQDDCKRCSIGTFVSEQRSPGSTAADCVACPYGSFCVCFGWTAPFFPVQMRLRIMRSDWFNLWQAPSPILVQYTKHTHLKWIIRRIHLGLHKPRVLVWLFVQRGIQICLIWKIIVIQFTSDIMCKRREKRKCVRGKALLSMFCCFYR